MQLAGEAVCVFCLGTCVCCQPITSCFWGCTAQVLYDGLHGLCVCDSIVQRVLLLLCSVCSVRECAVGIKCFSASVRLNSRVRVTAVGAQKGVFHTLVYAEL